MKRAEAAAIAAGWLTVALSMAAIGSAAVSHVGAGTASVQVQLTVPAAAPATTQRAVQIAPEPPAAPTIDASEAAALTTSVAVPSATVTAPTAAATAKGIAAVPPTAPIPTGLVSSAVPTGDNAVLTIADPVAKPSATSTATSSTFDSSRWEGPQGTVWARCDGRQILYVGARPADHYEVTKDYSWSHVSVIFDGPDPVTVTVKCYSSVPHFTTD